MNGMTSHIDWGDKTVEATLEDIRRLEQEFGVEYPQSYVDCVLAHNGAYPEPDVIVVPGDRQTIVQGLAEVNAETEHRTSVLEIHNDLRRFLPTGVIIFAQEPGGNYFCFDFRNVNGEPPVVFWDHERIDEQNPDAAILPVCGSFTEFLEMITD